MRKLIAVLFVLSLFAPAVSEAGIFRKRNGERRAPVRNVLRGGLFRGGCG